MRFQPVYVILVLAIFVSCTRAKTIYDELPILILNNTNGMQVHLSPVGATIQKLLVPGSTPGSLVDVALGHDNITLYTVSTITRVTMTLRSAY
jgi:hypothetical protein